MQESPAADDDDEQGADKRLGQPHSVLRWHIQESSFSRPHAGIVPPDRAAIASKVILPTYFREI
jgi:hypothetical protein